MCQREEHKSAFGHVCTGGGATIENSPVNITLNITLNVDSKSRLSDDEGRPTELARTLSAIGQFLCGGAARPALNDSAIRILEESNSRAVRAID